MPAEISVEGVLGDEARAKLAGGALEDDVLVQFICNTGPGGQHDPEKAPDDRVRPSHAAFHGKVFALRDAPVPPLDYGCRCALRYVARIDTAAAVVVKEVATAPETTPPEATRDWLEANVDAWRKVAKAASGESPKGALAAAIDAAKELGIDQPRSVAEMVVDVIRAGLL